MDILTEETRSIVLRAALDDATNREVSLRASLELVVTERRGLILL